MGESPRSRTAPRARPSSEVDELSVAARRIPLRGATHLTTRRASDILTHRPESVAAFPRGSIVVAGRRLGAREEDDRTCSGRLGWRQAPTIRCWRLTVAGPCRIRTCFPELRARFDPHRTPADQEASSLAPRAGRNSLQGRTKGRRRACAEHAARKASRAVDRPRALRRSRAWRDSSWRSRLARSCRGGGVRRTRRPRPTPCR